MEKPEKPIKPRPSSLAAIFRHDNHYAVSFEEARAEIEQVLCCYLGLFPLRKGPSPATDGRSIMLSGSIGEFRDSKADLLKNRNLSLHISDVIHETLHIREGSFLIDGRPFLATFPNQDLAHHLHNIVDDGRIEWNGRSYLKPNHIELLEKSNIYYSSKKTLPPSLGEAFLELFSCRHIVRGLPSRFNPACAAIEQEVLRAPIADEELIGQGITTGKELLDAMAGTARETLGKHVGAVWGCLPRIYGLATKGFPELKDYKPLKVFAVTLPNGQVIHVGFRGDGHDYSAAEISTSDLAVLMEAGKDARPKGASTVGIGEGKPHPDSNNQVQVITYDHLTKSYRHIEQLVIQAYPQKNPSFQNELSRHAHHLTSIRAHFELLKPNEEQQEQSQDPDEMNHEALIEVLADPSLIPTARIYDHTFTNTRDACTAVLLDISGSTAQELKNKQRVIDVEKLAAGLVHQALTAIGEPVRLYAFSTGNEHTRLYRLADLSDLGGLEPEDGNCDGVAIRGTVAELLKQSALEKKLIIIADGRPVATGSGADPVIDTAMAIMEAETRGIRVGYFNIDNQPSEYFKTLTSNATFAMSFPDISQLPDGILEFVRSLS